jgi:hypothetical protein
MTFRFNAEVNLFAVVKSQRFFRDAKVRRNPGLVRTVAGEPDNFRAGFSRWLVLDAHDASFSHLL